MSDRDNEVRFVAVVVGIERIQLVGIGSSLTVAFNVMGFLGLVVVVKGLRNVESERVVCYGRGNEVACNGAEINDCIVIVPTLPTGRTDKLTASDRANAGNRDRKVAEIRSYVVEDIVESKVKRITASDIEYINVHRTEIGLTNARRRVDSHTRRHALELNFGSRFLIALTGSTSQDDLASLKGLEAVDLCGQIAFVVLRNGNVLADILIFERSGSVPSDRPSDVLIHDRGRSNRRRYGLRNTFDHAAISVRRKQNFGLNRCRSKHKADAFFLHVRYDKGRFVAVILDGLFIVFLFNLFLLCRLCVLMSENHIERSAYARKKEYDCHKQGNLFDSFFSVRHIDLPPFFCYLKSILRRVLSELL